LDLGAQSPFLVEEYTSFGVRDLIFTCGVEVYEFEPLLSDIMSQQEKQGCLTLSGAQVADRFCGLGEWEEGQARIVLGILEKERSHLNSIGKLP